MRIIDSDPLKTNMITTIDQQGGTAELVTVLQVIDDAPTVQEIPEGHWVTGAVTTEDVSAEYAKCFICGNAPLYNDYGILELSKYCPFCGARMFPDEVPEDTAQEEA